MVTIGSRIKQLRKEMDYTQDDLAKILSITRSALANWETGRVLPDPISLIKLADVLGVTVDYLLGRSDIRKINYNITDFLDGLDEKEKASVINFIKFLKYNHCNK